MYFRINVTAGGTKFRLGQQKPRFVALAEAMDGLLLCAKNEETAGEILVSRVSKGEGQAEELANELLEEGRFWFGGHRWTLTEHVDYSILDEMADSVHTMEPIEDPSFDPDYHGAIEEFSDQLLLSTP